MSFVNWCVTGYEVLNVTKTKEMTIDFHKINKGLVVTVTKEKRCRETKHVQTCWCNAI